MFFTYVHFVCASDQGYRKTMINLIYLCATLIKSPLTYAHHKKYIPLFIKIPQNIYYKLVDSNEKISKNICICIKIHLSQ